jgi:hAT family C-terminal dimerisation region
MLSDIYRYLHMEHVDVPEHVSSDKFMGECADLRALLNPISIIIVEAQADAAGIRLVPVWIMRIKNALDEMKNADMKSVFGQERRADLETSIDDRLMPYLALDSSYGNTRVINPITFHASLPMRAAGLDVQNYRNGEFQLSGDPESYTEQEVNWLWHCIENMFARNVKNVDVPESADAVRLGQTGLDPTQKYQIMGLRVLLEGNASSERPVWEFDEFWNSKIDQGVVSLQALDFVKSLAAIPASSAESERAASMAGWVLDDRRMRMNDDTFSRLTRVKSVLDSKEIPSITHPNLGKIARSDLEQYIKSYGTPEKEELKPFEIE